MSSEEMKKTKGGFVFGLLALLVIVVGVAVGIYVGAEIGSRI